MKTKYIINPRGNAFISDPRRGSDGRIQNDYFERVILIKALVDGRYTSSDFKSYIDSLGILAAEDRNHEDDGRLKWRHRVDAAKQHLVIDKLLVGPPRGEFRIPLEK